MDDAEDEIPRGGSVQPPGTNGHQSTQHARHTSGSVTTDVTVASGTTAASGTSSVSMSDNSGISSFLDQFPIPLNNDYGTADVAQVTSAAPTAPTVDEQSTATTLRVLSLAFVIHRDLGDNHIRAKIHELIADWPDNQHADALVLAEREVNHLKALSGMSEPAALREEAVQGIRTMQQFLVEHSMAIYSANGRRLGDLVSLMEAGYGIHGHRLPHHGAD